MMQSKYKSGGYRLLLSATLVLTFLAGFMGKVSAQDLLINMPSTKYYCLTLVEAVKATSDGNLRRKLLRERYWGREPLKDLERNLLRGDLRIEEYTDVKNKKGSREFGRTAATYLGCKRKFPKIFNS